MGQKDCVILPQLSARLGLRQGQVIEPILRRQSPENGNTRGTSRRLSPDSAHIRRNRERIDRTPNGKSPPLAGLSSGIEGILPGRLADLGGFELPYYHSKKRL
jgi:hypothetical protein